MRGTKRRYEEVQPQLQRDIVNDYRRGVRGHGYLQSPRSISFPFRQSVIAQAERAGGDPVAPRGHKKRKLDSAEQARVYSGLDRNPFTTNQQLRARVGNKIAASTVSRYLAHAKPPFTAKVAQDQEPETNRGWEGRGTEMVESSQDDCNAQTNLRSRSPHLRE